MDAMTSMEDKLDNGTSRDALCVILAGAKGVICEGRLYTVPAASIGPEDNMFWIYIAIYVLLVVLSAILSALCIGLLTLDMTSLTVIQQGGTPTQRKQATRVLPIIRRHHLLLVTLLLGSTIVIVLMPTILTIISDPITATIISVTLELVIGEIFPQAFGSRYGLAIGAALAPFVYVVMFILFIIAWPLAKMLDCLLGTVNMTHFRRAELKVLVDLHGDVGHSEEGPLTIDEVLIIKGALEMKEKIVEEAMISHENSFMLKLSEKLDKDTMQKIVDSAHSRVPVYNGTRQNIIGVILIKTLLCLDPAAATPVATIVRDRRYSRPASYVKDSTPLFELLNEFQKGKSHLCMVYSSDFSSSQSSDFGSGSPITMVTNRRPQGIIVGVITLEDVIEELLQEEIIDETDVFIDVQKRVRVAETIARRRSSIHPDVLQALSRMGMLSPRHSIVPVATIEEEKDDDPRTNPNEKPNGHIRNYTGLHHNHIINAITSTHTGAYKSTDDPTQPLLG